MKHDFLSSEPFAVSTRERRNYSSVWLVALSTLVAATGFQVYASAENESNLVAEDKSVKAPPGFTALFNGKDLTGWKGHTTMTERAKLSTEKLAELQATRTATALKHWSVADGVIHCDGKGNTSLVTDKDYADFEFYVDWKLEKNGDSGLYLRGQPQVQIWDSDNSPGAGGPGDRSSGSGGLWNNPPGDKAKIPLVKADKPIGEWNTFHITMIGNKVTVELNGKLVVDKGTLPNYWAKGQPLPEKGPIELQFHNDPLWFRNIYVKELPPSQR